MDGSDHMNNNYQCCFCGIKIETESVNVTGLIVVSNWEKDRSEQQEQQLFCHMECLKEKVSSKVPLYIADLID